MLGILMGLEPRKRRKKKPQKIYRIEFTVEMSRAKSEILAQCHG
jgi:hypothetical protein